jgi:hypothetical protein
LLFGGKKMKKSLLLSGLLLLATSSAAFAAAGTSLRWASCLGDGGAQNRTSACTTNLGSLPLVGSFEMPDLLANVSGVELSLDVAVAGAALPAWWQYNAGECRQGSLSMNPTISLSAANCFDWANANAAGGLAAYNEGTFGPSSAHILGGFAVSAANLASLDPGVEWFAFNLLISNAKTTSTGACAGCLSPVCIVFNSIKVATPTNSILITGAASPGSNYATFQGGVGVSTLLGAGCPAATPTRSSTWGQVKSLYH